MYFKATILFSLAASALALPATVEKRAVLAATTYANFQVSSGVAGNALAEVQAKFPVRVHISQNTNPLPSPNLFYFLADTIPDPG